MLIIIRRKQILARVSFALLSCCCLASSRAETVPGLDDIVWARERVGDHVIDVDAKFKTKDPEYVKAKDLYRDARAKYEGWLSQVKAAIVIGRTKDLRKDEHYQKLAESAAAATKAFVDYAQQITVTTKGLPAFVAPLIDTGIQIWNAVKDRQRKDRRELADYVGSEAAWPRWEEITKANSSQTPTPRSDGR